MNEGFESLESKIIAKTKIALRFTQEKNKVQLIHSILSKLCLISIVTDQVEETENSEAEDAVLVEVEADVALEVATVEDHKCTKQPAANAAKAVKYHSDQREIVQFFVATALKMVVLAVQNVQNVQVDAILRKKALAETPVKEVSAEIQIDQCSRQLVTNAAKAAKSLSVQMATNRSIVINALKKVKATALQLATTETAAATNIRYSSKS